MSENVTTVVCTKTAWHVAGLGYRLLLGSAEYITKPKTASGTAANWDAKAKTRDRETVRTFSPPGRDEA